ncbi:MAG TPA: exostosin family protein [Methylomirabilota bacterium]|nr:exostosin family protein [Methylomirabilota bacterium]
MFTLHTDASLLPQRGAHVQMLDPFWGFERYDPEGVTRAASAEYMARAGEWFRLGSMEEADAGLIPADWQALLDRPDLEKRARDYCRRMAQAGKPVVIFFCTDAPTQVNWPENAIVFRIALHRSTRASNEFIVPQWSKDYIADECGGQLVIRPKEAIPVVGFCGYAPPLGMSWSKARLKESARLLAYNLGLLARAPERAAHAARARALLLLKRSPDVRANFVIRDQSAFANAYGALLPGGSVEQAKTFRAAFARNIIESDYVLCARGYANCSIRFYETLSMGRLPVLVDTDTVLPFESVIDWDRHAVIVKERDLANIGKRVRAHHDKMSPGEFAARQREARQLYLDLLSTQGFFGHLPNFIRAQKREAHAPSPGA